MKFIIESIVVVLICVYGAIIGGNLLHSYPYLSFIVGCLTGVLATISIFVIEMI